MFQFSTSSSSSTRNYCFAILRSSAVLPIMSSYWSSFIYDLRLSSNILSYSYSWTWSNPTFSLATFYSKTLIWAYAFYTFINSEDISCANAGSMLSILSIKCLVALSVFCSSFSCSVKYSVLAAPSKVTCWANEFANSVSVYSIALISYL